MVKHILGTHTFDFGDQMYLHTEFLDNGDNPNLCVNSTLQINDRVGRSASFNFVDLTAGTLRDLADELEKAERKAFENRYNPGVLSL